MGRYRNFCITSFSETIEYDKTDVQYIIYAQETCPTTQRLHYHIYLELKTQFSIETVKRLFNDNTLHVEPRKGTQYDAIQYVKKDGNSFTEYGQRKRQGKRTDIDNAMAMVEDGKSELDIAYEHPSTYLKYYKGLQRYKFLLDQERTKGFREVETTVLWGEAGTGKTRYVYDLNGYDTVYKLDSGDKLWFDGYEGQDVLLIDDFYGWIKYGTFLALLDGYPFRLDMKGSHGWANWTKVYITSNEPPITWYNNIGLSPALKRRLNNITKYPPQETTQ